VRIKLDENVHRDVVDALRAAGHDAVTIPDQNLGGCPDADVARAVKSEGRCLITFDLDFADPRRYPPQEFAGLVVLRLRNTASARQIDRIRTFLAEEPDVRGRLWIVEETRARDWTP
jgi:predicted nuclease of predicted toxin-antitoxin system